MKLFIKQPLTLFLGIFVASGVLAQGKPPREHAGLPPLEQVERMLDRHPTVLAAQSGVRAELSNRDRLVAGSNEFAMRIGAGQRHDPSRNFNEWDVAIERPLRSATKRDIDAQLGAEGVSQAKLSLGDARHETARALLRAWYGLLRDQSQADDAASQAALLASLRDAVIKRVAAGESPRIDTNLAEAALAQAQAQSARAAARRAAGRAEFARLFPEVTVPSRMALPPLLALDGERDAMRARLLEHNHELGVARAETRRRSALASRAVADRVGDPTVGVRYGSERAGSERIAGVFLSFPLPGAAREASAAGSTALVEVAAQREAALLRRIEAEFASAFELATGALDAARRAEIASAGLSTHADSITRAWQLGEATLPDVLTARRLAAEARVAAGVAALDSGELRHRLMLDSHLLWPIDADED